MDMNITDPIVIVNAKRTPIGAFQGVYKNYTATQLGTSAIASLIEDKVCEEITDVFMGCVLPAGLGQAPARQAALGAGISHSVPCTTLNKMCGSGLKTILEAHKNIQIDANKVIVAGGMENMSLAPYILPKARAGLRLGHGQLLDHMFYDGLEDAYNKGLLMGHFAERTAKKYGFSREMQDEFAALSVTRAKDAVHSDVFTCELVTVSHQERGREVVITHDEIPDSIKLDKIATLKPVFVLPEDDASAATVTAANSSSIADGAAAVLLMRKSKADSLGMQPLAKIIGYTEIAQEPEWFTTAPVQSINKLFSQTGLTKSDIDLFEINEAFAVVTMAALHDLKLDHNKVNIYGGACALGHPIGATGARILTTLIHGLRTNKKSLGVASLCIGGGEAIAMAIETL